MYTQAIHFYKDTVQSIVLILSRFFNLSETSQRKLLKQVEETIETQLDDGERRITAVQKASFLL